MKRHLTQSIQIIQAIHGMQNRAKLRQVDNEHQMTNFNLVLIQQTNKKREIIFRCKNVVYQYFKQTNNITV